MDNTQASLLGINCRTRLALSYQADNLTEKESMIISKHPQGSLEWLQSRAGVITASEMDQILTTDFELRKGLMPHSYMCRKLAEKWNGAPLAGFQSLDMEFGNILEEEAIPWLEFTQAISVQRVGLITTNDGAIGCSPDGLIGEDGGLECKCPRADNQVKYVLNNRVPQDYIVQVHAAMYVTGRKWWTFMSYHRRMPNLVLNVERDAEIMSKIADAMNVFLKHFNGSWERLCEINGGPPKRRAPMPQPQNEFVSQMPS